MPASSPPSSSGGARPLGLADLATFCQELAALVRARVPLSVGLGTGAFGSSRHLEDIAARLAEHEAVGRSVPEAMAAESSTWPPVIRAVVEAGLISGRLPDALEALARTARTQLDVRRRIGASLIYPAVILVVAAWLLATVSLPLVQGVRGVYETGPFGSPDWLDRLGGALRSVSALWFAAPLLVGGMAVWWVLRTRSITAGGVSVAAPLGWLPVLRGMRRNLRLATLADMLGLMTSQGVPLPAAWRLAGEATGNAGLLAECGEVSVRLAHGQPLSVALPRNSSFPPLFCDVLESAERQGGLPAAFRELAGIHYRRAEHTAEWIKMVAPIAATLCLGGAIVALYAATVFGPVLMMMYDLMRETSM